MTERPSRRAVVRRPERVRAEGMGDAALVAAMRDGDAWAWGEFCARYRPVLADFAHRAGADADEAAACAQDVLVERTERLVAPGAKVPAHLGPYLLRAARHYLLSVRRAAGRRERRHLRAAEPVDGGDRAVVLALVSAHVRRVSEGPERAWGDAEAADVPASSVVLQLAQHLRTATSPEDAELLVWVAEGVPHRTIAAWRGVRYDVMTKRIWRLSRRLRDAALRYAETLPAEARTELARFLRRAGALPPVVLAPAPPVDAASHDDPTLARFDDRAAAAGATPADPAARDVSGAAPHPGRTE
jgi:DNA-directed RNA polymerase specialized sigma24 family protein